MNSEILATSFHEAGHAVILITWTEDAGDKKFPFAIIRKPTVKTLFENHRWADIIFENNPCLRLAWPCIFFRKPHVVALRTWISRIDGKTGIQDIVKKVWLQTASAVIAVSDSVRKKSWPNAVVIGNPYRCDLFKLQVDTLRNKSFVFLGRLVSDKGADLAIQAVHALKNLQKKGELHDVDLSLTIIGDGEERPALQQMVSDLDLSGNVFFIGTQTGEPLVTSLNQHRYLLVPSLWEEPFGNVALEGMACGCIPIVSDGGGLPDAAGKAGVVFKRGDLPDLVQTILSILQNESFEQQLRNAATAHLADHHPQVVSKRYLSVIQKAMN